jgi:hypothetical protein
MSHLLPLQRCSSEMCVSIHLQDATVSSQNTSYQHGENPQTLTIIRSWFVIIVLECRFTWHNCTPSQSKEYVVEETEFQESRLGSF